MAIAFVDSNGARNISGTTLTISANVGTGDDRFLVCAVSTGEVNTGDLITDVTYAGVSMTRAGIAYQNSGSTRPVYLYYLKNPTSGTNNIVVTRSNSGIKECVWSAYTGVDDIHGTPFASRLTSSTPTRTVVTTVDDCVLVDAGILARVQTESTNTTINHALVGNTYSFRSTNPVAAGSNSLVTTQSDATQSAWVAIAMAPVGGAATAKNPLFFGSGL